MQMKRLHKRKRLKKDPVTLKEKLWKRNQRINRIKMQKDRVNQFYKARIGFTFDSWDLSPVLFLFHISTAFFHKTQLLSAHINRNFQILKVLHEPQWERSRNIPRLYSQTFSNDLHETLKACSFSYSKKTL